MPVIAFIAGVIAVWLFHSWRSAPPAAQQNTDYTLFSPTQLSHAQAQQVLGVGPDSSPQQIQQAYRRLIKKLHPDQGGSAYLSWLVTQARNCLLHSSTEPS